MTKEESITEMLKDVHKTLGQLQGKIESLEETIFPREIKTGSHGRMWLSRKKWPAALVEAES